MRTNIFLELQFKIVCNRLKENRVSRLFLRDDSRASKKSKSTDFGFFLYLLAKQRFIGYFSKIIEVINVLCYMRAYKKYSFGCSVVKRKKVSLVI